MKQTTNYPQPQGVTAPEIEIYYKTTLRAAERPKIKSASDVFRIMSEIGEMSRNMEYKELFYSLYLNTASELLAVHKISEGTTKQTLVDIKFIMQGAIMTNAAAVIVCHNHPSGSTSPSSEDKKITERIRNAAALFGVELTDSVIITTGNYFSFAAEGIF
ncbi:MAG: JAB domain-containing protein [Bacteroidales bacterium]|nr:JAB domain-containing protein [Bacteroidales bacterium]MBR4919448.1 JAB domain-containing protein [Bacteroidales bacterium]